MKAATGALIFVGACLFVAGGWATFILPLSTKVDDSSTEVNGLYVITKRTNLWGLALKESVHVRFDSPNQKPDGPGVRDVADEWILEGDLDWSGLRYGPWTLRERRGTEWRARKQWFLDGKAVTREHWDRGQ